MKAWDSDWGMDSEGKGIIRPPDTCLDSRENRDQREALCVVAIVWTASLCCECGKHAAT